jgi:plasmid maintenance system antidote protein VapI
MTVSESLKRAIETADVSRYRMAKDTGIDQPTLSRFINGERPLVLDKVDILADYLGLELKPKAKRKAR